jgi:hypothetical protein
MDQRERDQQVHGLVGCRKINNNNMCMVTGAGGYATMRCLDLLATGTRVLVRERTLRNRVS